jgi:hypothetical protein
MHWTIIATCVISACVNSGLYLARMWWETVRDQRREQALAALTSQLPAGGWLEEIRADGSEIRISIGRRRTPRTAQDDGT